MTDAGVVSGVSVSHANASIDEIASAGGRDARATVRQLLDREGVREAFALATCNRAEAYVVTDDGAAGRAALRGFAPEVRDAAVVELDHEESIRHLMRVAAGLESLVLGEDQIIGQVRRAIEDARAAGGIGPVFDEALTKALHVGERARTETGINDGVVSLGSAAVELAGRETELAGATALVVGAGEMGALAARSLADAGVARLVVANRTVPHAEHVVESVDVDADVDGRVIGLDAVPTAAREADVVIAATASDEPVLGPGAFRSLGSTASGAGTGLDPDPEPDPNPDPDPDPDPETGVGSPTVVIDVAQPRDVDPAVGDVPGVLVHDLDDLEAVTEETRAQRHDEAAAVEAMIDAEFDRLMDAFKRKRADEAIGTMYESAERVKVRELETALSKLETQGGLTDEQRETVEAMADALVGQLLAAPTKSLREAAGEDDWTTIQTAMQLFDPEFGAPPERPTGPDGPRALDDADLDADADEIPDHVLERLSND
jgi:glutamyl-tRNA reductase